MDLAHQAGVQLEEVDLELLDVLGAHHILAGVIDGQLAAQHAQCPQRPLERLVVAGDLSLGELQDQALVGAARQLEQIKEQPALKLPVQQALGTEGQADGAALLGRWRSRPRVCSATSRSSGSNSPAFSAIGMKTPACSSRPCSSWIRISRSCCNTT